ncbi:YaaA family protein [Granulicatella adiacens]|uniref:YaaA family protein n=1 Tax=Granulicatella adiacens TaxID=46124 RepID=UPI001C3C9191|nr:peroxide stress protein YaaA [Granulicatella adiacens]
MKFILSPAKEMNNDALEERDWEVSPAARKVVAAVREVPEEDLARVLGVKGKLLEENKAFIEGWKVAKATPAIELYNGLAFRWLKQVDGWNEGMRYGSEHVRILSALYDAVAPTTYIKPYRLDMLRPLRVDGQSLKAYWKAEWAELFEEGETVVNCASDEFSTLLDRSRYNWVDVEFYERKEGKLKQHSTTSKKGRGLLVGFAMREQVTDVKQLESFSEDGFTFDAELSTSEKLVFVR